MFLVYIETLFCGIDVVFSVVGCVENPMISATSDFNVLKYSCALKDIVLILVDVECFCINIPLFSMTSLSVDLLGGVTVEISFLIFPNRVVVLSGLRKTGTVV